MDRKGAIALLSLLLAGAPALGQLPGWQEVQNGWQEVQVAPGIGSATCAPPLACAGGAWSISATPTFTSVTAPQLNLNVVVGFPAFSTYITGSASTISQYVYGVSRFSLNGTDATGYAMLTYGGGLYINNGAGGQNNISVPANGVWQFGGVDSAAPAVQTLRPSGVVAGTADTAGAARFPIGGSIGTGAGAGGALVFQTAYPGAASTTRNTPADRWFPSGGWATLTDSTPTAFATATYGASTAVGAVLLVTVEAADASNRQSMSYWVQVNSVRKATGNTVTTVGVLGTPPTAAVTSGTLTATFTATEGASAATLNVTAASSLTTTTYRANFQTLANGAGLTVAPVGF